MQELEKFLSDFSNLVWGPWTLVLLCGTHVFLTFRLKFIQRYLMEGIKISFSRSKEGEGDISQFGALATALAATIGTGNIIGVATAIAAGGPGAVFWIWITGVFGIATKYAEALLSVKYRVKMPDGTMAGGPMYVLERGMNCKWLAVLFAAFTAVTAFGIGNMVQANSVAVLMKDTFQIPQWMTGLMIMTLTACVILGGIKSISRACEKLVPFMAIFNIVGCLILLVLKFDTIPEAFILIIRSAFEGQAVVGGFLGATMKEAMRFGIARGLFSNESGMGSGAIVASAAQSKNPVRQALVSLTGTFWDTVVMCALTGLVFVNSGAWTQGLNGAGLARAAFEDIPGIGPVILNVSLLTFVIATIFGWSYYGEKACEYLWGLKSIRPYRYLWVIAVMAGSVLSLPMVWSLADIANAFMAVPNLISLIVLHRVVVEETRQHLWHA